MTDPALALSSDLRDELARNAMIDPRSVPARYSTLKQFSLSPAHYLWAVQNQFDETLSMRLGSGADAMLFGKPWVLWTGKTRNGKAWDAFEAEHVGAVILNQSEHAKAKAMADAIRRDATASRLLFEGTTIEPYIEWEWIGRSFRSTPDAVSRTHCVDLKCLRSADPIKVLWQSRSMHYHCQAALYRRALNQTGQHKIKENYLVVVENKAPHPVTTLRFTEMALDVGDRVNLGWLEQLLECEASNKFPGYVQSIVELDLPVTDTLLFDDEDEE